MRRQVSARKEFKISARPSTHLHLAALASSINRLATSGCSVRQWNIDPKSSRCLREEEPRVSMMQRSQNINNIIPDSLTSKDDEIQVLNQFADRQCTAFSSFPLQSRPSGVVVAPRLSGRCCFLNFTTTWSISFSISFVIPSARLRLLPG